MVEPRPNWADDQRAGHRPDEQGDRPESFGAAALQQAVGGAGDQQHQERVLSRRQREESLESRHLATGAGATGNRQ